MLGNDGILHRKESNMVVPNLHNRRKSYFRIDPRIFWAFAIISAVVVVYDFNQNDVLELRRGKKKRPSSYDSSSIYNEVSLPLRTNICPNKIRAGDQYDGGWWLCSSESVAVQNDDLCVVYSFGIRDNFSFDHFLADRGCTVHGFDPSPVGLGSKAKYEHFQRTTTANNKKGQAVYHSFGLGKDGTYPPGTVPFRWPGMYYLKESNTNTWELKELPTIQKELKHDKVTILKIDIEGGEWDMMPDIIEAEWDELYLELHFYPGRFFLFETETGGLNVVETDHFSLRAQRAEQHVEPVDRIGLLKKLDRVADMFLWEPNGNDCVEIYFRRKKAINSK